MEGVNGASFSALQRAENSSIEGGVYTPTRATRGFSALQRAENSSIRAAHQRAAYSGRVSVLFSEPKIPQFGMW